MIEALPNRRIVLGALTAGVIAGPGRLMARGSRAGAGPFAIEDRSLLRQRLAEYLSLAGKNDPRRFEYATAASRRSEDSQSWKDIAVRTIALDDGGVMLAAEIEMRSASAQGLEGEPHVGLRFYRIEDGLIAETVTVTESSRFLPGGGEAIKRPPMLAHDPLPATVHSRRMTPAKFADYVHLFGHFDERFVEYYTEDVVFTAAPASAPLRGRDAILGLYRPLRKNLGEEMTIHNLVIDSSEGIMVVALINRLTAYAEVALPSRTLRAGDRLELSGAIIYGLRDGRISLIRDVGG